MSALCVNWLRRLADIPTSFHLWCAERELRMADKQALPAALGQARARNLDLLHAYRERGEFPHNEHETSTFAPCFVDAEGRLCAVAFLMTESGAKAEAAKIAAEANYARIGDMPLAVLETWASETGLSKDELARIQPSYPTAPENATEIVVAVCLLSAIAVSSILFNIGRLLFAYKPRWSTIALGLISGLILLYFGWQQDYWFSHCLRRFGVVVNNLPPAMSVGVLSVLCAVFAFCVRLTKPPTDSHAEKVDPNDRSFSPSSEHIQILQTDAYRSGTPHKGLRD
jgi:hypothetical protein